MPPTSASQFCFDNSVLGTHSFNDLTSAKYISEKCGKVTIAVTNNQMPMQPLFSPIYNSTRPYSKTRSNIQRDLMQPDEVLRLDQQKCLALFQGHRPALLYKLTPEELPDFAGLTTCRVVDYIPAWKQKAQETPTTAPRKEEKSPVEERTPAPQAEPPVSPPDSRRTWASPRGSSPSFLPA